MLINCFTFSLNVIIIQFPPFTLNAEYQLQQSRHSQYFYMNVLQSSCALLGGIVCPDKHQTRQTRREADVLRSVIITLWSPNQHYPSSYLYIQMICGFCTHADNKQPVNLFFILWMFTSSIFALLQ